MNEKIASDGTRHGEPIPGSRYLRSFCQHCNNPVRITTDQITNKITCVDCDGTNGQPGMSRSEKSLNTIDADPDMFGILKY